MNSTFSFIKKDLIANRIIGKTFNDFNFRALLSQKAWAIIFIRLTLQKIPIIRFILYRFFHIEIGFVSLS